MGKYRVKGTDLRFNGKKIAEGEEVELTEKEAKKLGDIVEPVSETKKSEDKSDKGGKKK